MIDVSPLRTIRLSITLNPLYDISDTTRRGFQVIFVFMCRS